MKSALYEGVVAHRRLEAPARSFSYSLFMVYLDLSELGTVFRNRWLWSTNGPALAWLRRADHFGDPEIPLDQSVRDLVRERTGTRPTGPIRLLTHLRYFGYCFNPVSFFYCFARDGRTLETVVAEVNNTPWGERHLYVLPESMNRGTETEKRYRFPKAFHVSPFLDMGFEYRWQLGVPGEQLVVQMQNVRGEETAFSATLSMTRRELGAASTARALALFPLMTTQVVVSIYWQALRLLVSGARFYPHPRSRLPS